MAIKRGVSLYSYQQEQFFGRMDYHDMAKELHDNLKCDGVEIIEEATVPGFPFPSKAFLADWANTMARYDLQPTVLDGFLDPLRFRDHVMNYGEAAESLKLELQLAHDMGFTQVRAMTALPNEVIERALDTAERLGVAITWEIHNPITIKPNPAANGNGLYSGRAGTCVQDTVEFIKKTGTKMVGFIPDMGIFNKAPYLDGVKRALRQMKDRDRAAEITAMMDEVPLSELGNEIDKRFPDMALPKDTTRPQMDPFHWKPCCQPEDLIDILPYCFSFHAKCHDMVEIPGHPGEYTEPAEKFEEVIQILKDNNWSGYLDTEFEGQRQAQDLPEDQLVDEIEQVRRNQEMLKRLIGE